MRFKDVPAKDAPWPGRWADIVYKTPGYEHPEYSRELWKQQVAAGVTQDSYAQVVGHILETAHYNTPLPKVLRQFRPRKRYGAAAKRAIAQSFIDNGVHYDKSLTATLWWAIVAAYENLIPFVVVKMNDQYVIVKDGKETRSDIKEMELDLLYEWDGYIVPRYGDQ